METEAEIHLRIVTEARGVSMEQTAEREKEIRAIGTQRNLALGVCDACADPAVLRRVFLAARRR